MDTYHWVWGVGEDFKEDRITVDVQHRRGSSPHYPSKLKKTFKLEDVPRQEVRLEILRRRLAAVRSR